MEPKGQSSKPRKRSVRNKNSSTGRRSFMMAVGKKQRSFLSLNKSRDENSTMRVHWDCCCRIKPAFLQLGNYFLKKKCSGWGFR